MNAPGFLRSSRRRKNARKNAIERLPTVIANTARLIDAIVLLAAALLAYWIYFDTGEVQPSYQALYHILISAAIFLQLNVFQRMGIYRAEKLTNVGYQLTRSFMAATILFLLLVTVLYIVKMSAAYSRGWMFVWFTLTWVGLATVRSTLCPAIQKWIDKGHLAPRVAIVGGGEPAQRLAKYLATLQSAPVHVVGVFDDGLASQDGANPRMCDGTVDQLCELSSRQDIDEIILATPRISDAQLVTLLRKMRSLPVDVRLCRDTLDYCLPQSSYEFCGIVPLLRLYDRPFSGWNKLAKNIEDVILAALFLLLLSPVFLIVAVLVKLGSTGPVLFKQKRYGFANRVITVRKFRTMYHNQTDYLGRQQVTTDDPRVTRIGFFLRRWRLDELPQLIDVLLGDMSIVGPRPHPLMCGVSGQLFAEVVEEYAARHRMKPGITGWAQVHGWHGPADSLEKIRQRVNHDLHYIDNWSMLLDFQILVMTLLMVIKRKNI